MALIDQVRFEWVRYEPTNVPNATTEDNFRPVDNFNLLETCFIAQRVPTKHWIPLNRILTRIILQKTSLVFENEDVSSLHPLFNLSLTFALYDVLVVKYLFSCIDTLFEHDSHVRSKATIIIAPHVQII